MKFYLKVFTLYLKESRKEWLKKEFAYFGSISPHGQNRQFSQNSNLLFDPYSNTKVDQKINYIHNNPIAVEFTDSPQEW